VLFVIHGGAVFFVCILYSSWCFISDEKEGAGKVLEYAERVFCWFGAFAMGCSILIEKDFIRPSGKR